MSHQGLGSFLAGLDVSQSARARKPEPRNDTALPKGPRRLIAIETNAGHATPNTDMAMAFLDKLDPYPDARWDLVAINPNLPNGAPGKIECATFLRRDWDKMRRWIEQRQGKKNLYVSVNRARPDVPHNVRLNHKTEKHIGKLRAIPADIDIKKIQDVTGQNFRAKRGELLQKIAPMLASDPNCPPTFLVDSGGGLQPWWFFETLVDTPENDELVEGIGRSIKERFTGELDEGFKVDSVADAARIYAPAGYDQCPRSRKES